MDSSSFDFSPSRSAEPEQVAESGEYEVNEIESVLTSLIAYPRREQHRWV